MGGRIVRDKLWFYGSGRSRQEIDDIVQCFQPDGSPCTQNQLQTFTTGKVSYQISKSNRLVGFEQWSYKESRIRRDEIRRLGVAGRARMRACSPAKSSGRPSRATHCVTSLQFGHWNNASNFFGYVSRSSDDRGQHHRRDHR